LRSELCAHNAAKARRARTATAISSERRDFVVLKKEVGEIGAPV
jgi:hypothetical protein